MGFSPTFGGTPAGSGGFGQECLGLTFGNAAQAAAPLPPPAPVLPSVVATIGYGPVHTNGGIQPENPVNINGATINTSIFAALVITSQTGTIARVDWYTDGGTGFVLRRDDDVLSPYNPKVGTDGIPVDWWDNSSNGQVVLRARVVFTDGFQDIDASITVAGNQPTWLGSSLGAYLTQPGGLLIMRDGDYTISDFAQPATQRTSWLVLKAETPHGVKIKPRDGGDVTSEHVGYWTHLNKVLFVGIDFVDVRINPRGCEDVIWWYTDHTYPLSAHPTPGSGLIAENPVGIQFDHGGSPARRNDRCAVYGADFHDFAVDDIHTRRSDNIKIVGSTLGKVAPGAYGSVNGWHADASQLSGRCQNLRYENCWIKDRCVYFIEEQHNQESMTITLQNTWVSGSRGVGFDLAVRESTEFPNPTAILTLNRTNVNSWGHSGADTWFTAHEELVDVNDTNYSTSTGTGTDPATAWKQANLYDTWSTYLGITV